jgi:hypothetical protein
MYSGEHVQLPNRVLLLRSPCAPHLQVPCSASRVVPGAHRVIGPGTHRGSGPGTKTPCCLYKFGDGILGCYKSTPLKKNLVPRFGEIEKN